MNTNLTATQLDYSQFVPAVSSFYSGYIGKQRFGNYVDPARIPKSFQHGIESLNFLDPVQGAFYYKWCLYSAGHANLDLTKPDEKEDMFRNRDRSTSWAIGDSGGFQIAKGCWPADWKDPNCPKAMKKRQQVLAWMDGLMDYGMTLDVPAWVEFSPKGREATKVNNYGEALLATYINNDYFMQHRSGACKFLNVLQGNTQAESDDWYSRMKKYCDPKQYPGTHFDGWAMGGNHTGDMKMVLQRLVQLRYDGLLEPGVHDRMHFLGISKLEWAVLLTDIQRAVRKYHNENFTITFDCASPFLATANGQIYTHSTFVDRSKWTYNMTKSLDDKKYATDSRLFKDAAEQDGYFRRVLDKKQKRSFANSVFEFDSSPIIDQCTVADICHYAPGAVNKINKIGKTSWDSFSYTIQMGHNVYNHIVAVQEANRQYDNGIIPSMLVLENFDRAYFKDIVEAVFAAPDQATSYAIIDTFEKYWFNFVGVRGKRGLTPNTAYRKLVDEEPSTSSSIVDEPVINERNLATTHAAFSSLFDVVEDEVVEEVLHDEDFSDDEQNALDALEEGLDNE